MMSADSPKEWLEPMIYEWRDQTFRLWSGEDGWPERTVLGRIIEEGAGASHQGVTQRTFETYIGDGLAVRMAIEGMPIIARRVFAHHYLGRGCAKEKQERLGLKKARYWELLGNAYFWIAGHMHER